MKIVLILLLGMASLQINTEEATLADLRKSFYKAAQSSSAAYSFTKMTKSVTTSSEPVLLCYKGAAYMMEAKYAFNPITKLSLFNKGKVAIEQAIKRQPNQLEMRFVSFSIQTNLPSFLGYNDDVQADKTKLLAAVSTIGNKELRQNVINYLITSKKVYKRRN